MTINDAKKNIGKRVLLRKRGVVSTLDEYYEVTVLDYSEKAQIVKLRYESGNTMWEPLHKTGDLLDVLGLGKK